MGPMERNIFMQDNAHYDNLINKVKNMGTSDANSGVNQELTLPVINGYATEFVEENRSENIRKGEVNEINLSSSRSRLEDVKDKIKQNRDTLLSIPVNSIYKAIIYYLIPAAIYIICDVFFSKELIVQGWGLGLSSAFEKWSLALGIGLAPFLVKFLFDRFVEPAYLSSNQSVKRFITGFYITLGIGVVMAFLQVAYLRGVIFKYSKISIIGNAYDSLYSSYPYLMTASFVTVAFMFVIGGGVLMSIGGNMISNWSKTKKLLREIDDLKMKQQILEDNIREFLGLSAKYKMLKNDDKNISVSIERLQKDLIYQYESAHKTVLTQRTKAIESEKVEKEDRVENHDTIPQDNFHEYAREILDKASRNGVAQLLEREHVQ